MTNFHGKSNHLYFEDKYACALAILAEAGEWRNVRSHYCILWGIAMFGLGTTELILILIIVIVLFGAKRLPQVGAGLAKGIKSFRSNISDEEKKNESTEDVSADKK